MLELDIYIDIQSKAYPSKSIKMTMRVILTPRKNVQMTWSSRNKNKQEEEKQPVT